MCCLRLNSVKFGAFLTILLIVFVIGVQMLLLNAFLNILTSDSPGVFSLIYAYDSLSEIGTNLHVASIIFCIIMPIDISLSLFCVSRDSKCWNYMRTVLSSTSSINRGIKWFLFCSVYASYSLLHVASKYAILSFE
jgi:hypothetical protein